MMPTGKSCKELMSLDWQQKAGESGDKTEGTGTGVHCRTRPQESLWQVPLPHTQLSNTISSHAPQTEFDLLLKSEELSRLLLKSTRFCRIICRLPNMKKPTAIFFFYPCFNAFFLPKQQQVFWAALSAFPQGSETISATKFRCKVINYSCTTSLSLLMLHFFSFLGCTCLCGSSQSSI